MEQLNLLNDFFDGGRPEFKIENKIRLIELFAGVGSQAMALERLGADFEHYRVVEFDKYAIASYNAIHGTDFPTMDITEIKGEDLGIVDTDKYCYLLTYSFPCVTEDSLILTSEGYKPIKDIRVGDTVLTKSNQWHKVAKKFDNGKHQTCYINAFGFADLHCTLNHKFYVREMYRKYPRYENGKRGKERHFKEPKFKEAKDLTRKDYFGIPVVEKEIPFYTDDLDFWYMIGFYVGDGYLSVSGYDIRLCCNDTKLKKLQSKLDADKWKYTIGELNKSCHKLRFANKEIYNFIKENIGTGCCGKRIPTNIINLPKEQLSAFLQGYIDSDGNLNNGYIRISSVNKQLMLSASMIINKLYHRPVSINKEKPRKKKHCIDGRLINNNHPLYELKYKLETNKQDKAFYEDGYIWFPFYDLTMAETENVYNIEVEEDHSYILEGCISKNCTDLSVAGKQEGMAKGSGTRSGLLWEVERLLKETKELPQVLVMENVPQVHGEKFKADFLKWLDFLTNLGYTNFHEDLNARYYGVPQNRDRTIMVSLLGNYKFKMPKPIPLYPTMNNLLEDEVDDRYFLNSEKANKLIEELLQGGKLDNLPDKHIHIPPDVVKLLSAYQNEYNEAISVGCDLSVNCP